VHCIINQVNMNSQGGANPAAGANGNGGSGGVDATGRDPFPLVAELIHPDRREAALLELSKKRENYPDLAPILWHSVGTITALLQEIVSIYPLLTPPQLTAQASNRVCNALALMQCVASHPETRTLFLGGEYPLLVW
jgi:CCR4-NOT transcription complex subunit 9